jgi:hypothetical protein
MFSIIEDMIGKWGLGTLQKEMIEAGKELREMAILRHDLHEGVPAITVVIHIIPLVVLLLSLE